MKAIRAITTLEDLDDVDITGIVNNQSIKWNSSLQKFIPYTPAVSGGGGGGSSPGGTGTEIQYRLDSSTFGGVFGSSVVGSGIILSGFLQTPIVRGNSSLSLRSSEGVGVIDLREVEAAVTINPSGQIGSLVPLVIRETPSSTANIQEWKDPNNNNLLFVDADGNINFLQKKAVAMVVDSGPTLPTTPVSGQWFLHSPVGRSVLMIHSGTAWVPIISLSAMTMYVDTTNGTDNQNLGWGTGTNAFKTVQFAVNQIPTNYGGNVLILAASGTYNETVTIRGKSPTGNFTITIRGAMGVLATIVSSGGVQGSGATYGSVNGAWNTSWVNKWMMGKNGSNNNVYRIIDSVSGTVATVVGYWAAAVSNGHSFDVCEPFTNVNQINAADGQQNVIIENINFSYTENNFSTIAGVLASTLWRRCKTEFATGGNIQTGGLASVTLEEVLSVRTRWFLMNQTAANIRSCKFIRAQTTTGSAARTLQTGAGTTINIVSRPSVFDGDNTGVTGIYGGSGANISLNNLFCIVRNYISGANGIGMRSESTSSITESGSTIFSNNATNTSADAASYGVIA